MKNYISFIHAADIHLGSILNIKAFKNEELEKITINAVLNSFEKIVDLSIVKQVDFIIFSGDIFDGYSLTVEVDKLFAKACERLNENNISVYIVAGNHDPLRYKQYLFKLPSNVHIFSSKEVEKVVYKKEGLDYVNLFGISYENKYLKSDVISQFNKEEDKHILNIGILHTDLKKKSPYAPCLLGELKEVNIDYWALGHIHKNDIINKEPLVVYPGIPQGRDMGEQKAGGVYFVKYDGKELEDIEFIEVCSAKYNELTVEVKKNIVSLDEVNELVIKEILKFNSVENLKEVTYITKVILNVVTEDNMLNQLKDIQLKEIVDEINESLLFYNEKYIVDSMQVVNSFKSSKDNVDPKILGYINEEIKEISMRKDLSDIWGEAWIESDLEEIEYDKFKINEEEISEIMNRACEMIIKELSGEVKK